MVSLRSAGGAGGMQMMSTWCSPSPEPVPWTAAPVKASPMAPSPASTLTELTSQMWTLVSTEYCIDTLNSDYKADVFVSQNWLADKG